MGRPKGSKNSSLRAKPRSAWETYNYWYDKYTKGAKAGWFREKLSKPEFESMYNTAKQLGWKNPARSIARAQEYVDRDFERKYKKLYGKEMGDIRDKDDRVKMFQDFVDDCIANGMTYDEGREEFERYFY